MITNYTKQKNYIIATKMPKSSMKKVAAKKNDNSILNCSKESQNGEREDEGLMYEQLDKYNNKKQESKNNQNKPLIDTGVTTALTNLLKLITGFEIQEEKIFREKDGTITRDYITVHYPPNLAAIKYYLDNHGKELGFGKALKVKEKPESIQPPDAIFTREDMSNGQTPPIE